MTEHGDPCERVCRELRKHYEGRILFGDGLSSPVRYVVHSASGRLVMPVEPGVAAADVHTLFIPEERDDALQAMIALAPADPFGDAGEPCDRWQAYHAGAARSAAPARIVWVWGTIEAAKLMGEVCEGEEITAPNPLRAEEPRLCRELNRRCEAVAAACRARAGLEVASPLVVGVDARGIDVRARFGIVRLEFDRVVSDARSADEAIARVVPGA